MRKRHILESVFEMRYTRKYINKYYRQISSANLFSIFLCVVIVGVPLSCILFGFYLAAYLGPPPSYFPARGVIADIQTLNYSWYNTHNLTIDFYGRLGNHLFQYASLYGIAKANGLIPIIKADNILLDIFPNMKCKVTQDKRLGKNYGLYKERKSNAFDQRTFSLNFMNNLILSGFFQSWRYFDHVRTDIKKQFTFHPKILMDVEEFFKSKVLPLSNHLENPIYIGIHIRRGDFFSDENQKLGYTVSDLSYIQRAMRYFEIKFSNIVFIIVSDDIEWCVNNVSSEHSVVLFSPFHASSNHDLCLLSRGNHTIVTGGTFGWWGAYLAGGQVVYDKNFPEPLSKLRDNYKLSDYYMNSWRGL